MKKEIRQLVAAELMDALDLAWTVFSESAGKECTEEGREEFWRSTDYEYVLHRTGDADYRVWGAFYGEDMVGMCILRDECHIDMLFVETDAQKKGVGSSLLKRAVMDAKRADETFARVTVNAFTTAVGFFEKLGFQKTGEPRIEDGIPFTPMLAQSK